MFWRRLLLRASITDCEFSSQVEDACAHLSPAPLRMQPAPPLHNFPRLNHLVYALRKEEPDQALLRFLQVDEMLVDIGECRTHTQR